MEIEELEHVGVAYEVLRLHARQLLLRLLADRRLPKAAKQAFVEESRDLPFELARGPVLIRRLMHVPLAGRRVVDTHEEAEVGPGRFLRQCRRFGMLTVR